MQRREFPEQLEPDETPEEYVTNRLADVNAKKGYSYAQANPGYPEYQKQKDVIAIDLLCKEIEDVLPKVEGLMKKIFSGVGSITEQTKTAAVYMLIGKAYGSLQSALLLCRDGRNIEALEICRSGKEALDLVIVFWEDENANLLSKWFKGKIIDPSEVRDFQHKLINRELADYYENEEQPIKDLLRNGYKIMSVYTHSAYSGLLDNVDVFNMDFDFERYGGYHYCIENFHVVEDLLIKILLQLQSSALKVGDTGAFTATKEISKRFDVNLTKEQMKIVLAKYKKQAENKS